MASDKYLVKKLSTGKYQIIEGDINQYEAPNRKQMKIPKEVKEAFEKEQYLTFGTADKKGVPNVVIIGFKRILNDDTIWVFDSRFNKSKSNILENENVSLCIFHNRESAFQIKGTAKYIDSGKVFEDAVKWSIEKGKKKKTMGVVEIKVKEIYNLDSGKLVNEER